MSARGPKGREFKSRHLDAGIYRADPSEIMAFHWISDLQITRNKKSAGFQL